MICEGFAGSSKLTRRFSTYALKLVYFHQATVVTRDTPHSPRFAPFLPFARGALCSRRSICHRVLGRDVDPSDLAVSSHPLLAIPTRDPFPAYIRYAARASCFRGTASRRNLFRGGRDGSVLTGWGEGVSGRQLVDRCICSRRHGNHLLVVFEAS